MLKMVPAIIAKIASTAGKTNLQDVANNLDALVSLQGSVAEVGPLLAPGQSGSFLRRAADRLNRGLPQLQGTDLYMNMPSVVWACTRSGLHDHPLFVSVAFHASRPARSLRNCQIGIFVPWPGLTKWLILRRSRISSRLWSSKSSVAAFRPRKWRVAKWAPHVGAGPQFEDLRWP